MPEIKTENSKPGSSAQSRRYLVTSALPYANGLKHIGHLAGAYIPADIYVRYLRAQKRDVVFVCGSDEHGTAIPIQAMKEGTTPQAIIDKYHVIMKQNFDDLSISFDVYDRTSNPIHHETLAGSDSDIKTDGKILFLEDTGEYLYSIDRMFWNLKRTGKLDHLKGLVIGGFRVKPDDPGEEFGRTLQDIVLEKTRDHHYPVCFDFPVGHQRANFALKCGIKHQLAVKENEVTLTERS